MTFPVPSSMQNRKFYLYCLLAFFVQSPADCNDTRQNDGRREGNESTTFSQQFGWHPDPYPDSNPRSLLVGILALVEVCAVWSQSFKHYLLAFLVQSDVLMFRVSQHPALFILADWRRQPGRPRITWLSTVQQDLKQHLMLPEAADLAQNCPPMNNFFVTYGAL